MTSRHSHLFKANSVLFKSNFPQGNQLTSGVHTNKENEQPKHLIPGSVHNLSHENGMLGNFHKSSKSGNGLDAGQIFQTFQNLSQKTHGQISVHAPRNSFNKRSFGRDLSNLQNMDPQEYNKHAFLGNQKKVFAPRNPPQGQKTKSSFVIQNPPNPAQAYDVAQPQILSQTNSIVASLAKMKTFGELKNGGGSSTNSTAGIKPFHAIAQNIQVKTGAFDAQNCKANRVNPSSRIQERKTITCLSQDRLTSSVGVNSTSKTNQSFVGTSSACNPLVQSQMQGRAQTSMTGAHPKSQEYKHKRLQKFNNIKKLYYESQLCDIDLRDNKNVQSCAEYASEIFSYLKSVEHETAARLGYMDSLQTDINEKMRSILVDWLVEVHLKFKLLPETLYLTVNLIDRYLSLVPIHRQRLQLVGVTAMLIACKYEEIYPPIVKDFVFITDNAYTKDEILEMEKSILTQLDFDVQITSAYRYLERYWKVAMGDLLLFHLSQFLIELTLPSYKMLKYHPSLLAASAVYLSLKMTKRSSTWSEALVTHSQFSEGDVRPCAKELFVLLQEAPQLSTQAVRKKFSLPKFGEVSKIRLEPPSSTHNSNGQVSASTGQSEGKRTEDQSTDIE